jgi:formate dehydrogenase gamma subunit
MRTRPNWFDVVPLLLVAACVSLRATTARAGDSEGCLTCHQYRGLAKVKDDGRSIALYYVNPNYYSQSLGPHARLKCTDCHVREQVEVYPHLAATPVDCARTCHLDSRGKVETRFSHARVGEMLGHSAHTPEALKKANALLPEPLRADQANCLLCHDEPSFNRSAATWVGTELPVNRCNTCHTEELPVETRHMYSHVTARSVPARTNADMMRVCAVCHANEKVRAEFKLPDSVGSYLNSFHGKAALLGSQETASCLDCHVAPLQNAHMMLAKEQPLSSVHPVNLPDTCRSPACHASAGERISTASVHLDLPTSRGVEFLIAVGFVVLIVFTFGPSLLICLLKLVQVITGRHDRDDHRRHELANKLLAVPGTRAKLQRFNLHQRLQHWFLAVTFILLCLSGFPMKFADRPWAARVIAALFGSLPAARQVHHVCGALLIGGFVYHLTYVLLTLRRNLKTRKQGFIKTVLSLPMAITPADGLQMMGLMLYLVGIKKHRPAGARFNPEEKFEYIGVFWGTFVLGTTGLLMWLNAYSTRYLPGRILTIATLVHTFEAFLALLHVGIVHMASVIFSPGVFPVSKAMFTGQTPTEELVEGHAAMLDAVAHETKTPEAAHA